MLLVYGHLFYLFYSYVIILFSFINYFFCYLLAFIYLFLYDVIIAFDCVITGLYTDICLYLSCFNVFRSICSFQRPEEILWALCFSSVAVNGFSGIILLKKMKKKKIQIFT